MVIGAPERIRTAVYRVERSMTNNRPACETAMMSHHHAVLVGGYAGSGKSLFSRILANHTHWTLLDKDTLTSPLAEATLEALGRPSHDRKSAVYLSKVRPREYEVLTDTLMENLRHGASVICRCPVRKSSYQVVLSFR